MDSRMILKEIRYNVNQIFVRCRIIFILVKRVIFSKKRNQKSSYEEYDNYWRDFWQKKDYLREDLPITYNKSFVTMSPLDFKKQTIIKIVSDIIEKYNIKSVLEVGAGAGLNLVYLSSKYNDVKFYGIEPTKSGVDVAHDFIKNSPSELLINGNKCNANNIYIKKGSILNTADLEEYNEMAVDLVFTNAVLEQLHNDIDQVFDNMFKINTKYYLLNEEWLDGNSDADNYRTLVKSDYFRIPWSYINKYKNVKCIELFYPLLQPSWFTYTALFLKRI